MRLKSKWNSYTLTNINHLNNIWTSIKITKPFSMTNIWNTYNKFNRMLMALMKMSLPPKQWPITTRVRILRTLILVMKIEKNTRKGLWVIKSLLLGPILKLHWLILKSNLKILMYIIVIILSFRIKWASNMEIDSSEKDLLLFNNSKRWSIVKRERRAWWRR